MLRKSKDKPTTQVQGSTIDANGDIQIIGYTTKVIGAKRRRQHCANALLQQ